MMCFEPLGLVADDAEVAATGRLVDGQVRHSERLDVAADGGQRRHQLVRHVGEQLPPGSVGGLERVGPLLELAGHLVERARERGDLVAAGLGRPDPKLARADRARCFLKSTQPLFGRA